MDEKIIFAAFQWQFRFRTKSNQYKKSSRPHVVSACGLSYKSDLFIKNSNVPIQYCRRKLWALLQVIAAARRYLLYFKGRLWSPEIRIIQRTAGVELLKLAYCFSCVRWIDDENNLQLCQNLQQNYLVGKNSFNIYFGFAGRILSFF